MRRLFCILCPPLAVLSCGKPFSAMLNFLLTLCIYFPGLIHAWGVVTDYRNLQNARLIANAARR